MDCEERKDRRYEVLFGIRRSVRYHARRRAFFDRLHMVTGGVSVIFGSATIFALFNVTEIGAAYAALLPAVVTVFGAIDLVVGFPTQAREHQDLYRRFIVLEQRLISISEEALTEEKLNELTSERLAIEADELPVLKVLDMICHNEQLRSEGFQQDSGEYVDIKWYQRALAQLLDVQPYRIDKPPVPVS